MSYKEVHERETIYLGGARKIDLSPNATHTNERNNYEHWYDKKYLMNRCFLCLIVAFAIGVFLGKLL